MSVSFADLLGKIVEWLICQKGPFWARRLQYTSVPRQMMSIPPPNMSISGHHVCGSSAWFRGTIFGSYTDPVQKARRQLFVSWA